MGSDVLNHFHPNEKIHRTQDKQFFSEFPNLVVLEREGIPITDKVREYISQTWNIKIYSPVTPNRCIGIPVCSVGAKRRQGDSATIFHEVKKSRRV